MAPKTSFPRRGRRFLAIFGSLLGSLKSPKIDIFFKKPSQGALFHRFLLRMSFFSIFLLILNRFLMKIQWEKLVFFKHPSRFFQHGDPHDSMYFIGPNALFTCFCFICFLKKLMENTSNNLSCQKMRKITSWAPQNGPKMVKKSSTTCEKSQK